MNVSNLLAANTSLGCMLAGARSLRGNVYTTPYPIHCPHIGSQYAYMDDLWQLDRSPASVPRVWLRSQVLQPSPTPLLAPVWQAALRDYPDPRLRHFLVQGLQEGFRIGYNAPRGQLRPAKRNIPSSYEHPEVVDKYLANECKLGRVLGPWLTPPPCPIHISRFGVIPKKSQPGKWRLIVDLSFPEGAIASMMAFPLATAHCGTPPLIWVLNKSSQLDKELSSQSWTSKTLTGLYRCTPMIGQC